MFSKSKFSQLLEIFILVSLKTLSTNMTLIFSDLISRVYIWQIISKIKTSYNLLESLHSMYFLFKKIGWISWKFYRQANFKVIKANMAVT